MRYFPASLLVLIIVIGVAPVAAETIKKTSSGICHPPESSHYDRTENFQAFDSLETCLVSGGRLPKQLASSDAPNLDNDRADSYRRSAFGHGWDDADSDCQNSRAEALIASSSTPVRFASDNRCRVVAGRWISPFTGNVIQNSQAIDIDHVVPLKWAWERGANTWTSEKRERFANDPVNLWSVELGLNRSKGAQPPNEWLPPAGHCGYVTRFLRIVKRYGLKPSERESQWLSTFVSSCRS